MNVYKVELLVVDSDGLGPEGVRATLENARYPNHCMSPSVMSIDAREVEWDDAHPLNMRSTQADEFRRLFAKETPHG